MGNIVEVCFNPYSCTTQILINGKPPSEYSSLIQFMTEPLYLWCNSLFDLLYSEINDKFSMIFTGRKFDADILKYLATNNDNCISFKHRTFMTDTPLQKRMILLNEVIKKGGIIREIFITPKVIISIIITLILISLCLSYRQDKNIKKPKNLDNRKEDNLKKNKSFQDLKNEVYNKE